MIDKSCVAPAIQLKLVHWHSDVAKAQDNDVNMIPLWSVFISTNVTSCNLGELLTNLIAHDVVTSKCQPYQPFFFNFNYEPVPKQKRLASLVSKNRIKCLMPTYAHIVFFVRGVFREKSHALRRLASQRYCVLPECCNVPAQRLQVKAIILALPT